MICIDKKIWREISSILKKYRIPYTTHYEDRNVRNAENNPITIVNKHIQINLTIPDYFKEENITK